MPWCKPPTLTDCRLRVFLRQALRSKALTTNFFFFYVMNVTINGEKVVVSPGSTIVDALKGYDLPQLFVVEVNGEIIDNNNLADYPLNDNDIMEIIRFVGGG